MCFLLLMNTGFHFLREHVYQQPVKGRMIAMQRVPLSMQIRARRVGENDKLLLKYHFEARAVDKLYGGNEELRDFVTDLEVKEDSAIVTFVNRAGMFVHALYYFMISS